MAIRTMIVLQLVLFGVLISNLAYTEDYDEYDECVDSVDGTSLSSDECLDIIIKAAEIVSIRPHPNKAKEGETYTLECRASVNLSDVLQTRLRWVRKTGDKKVSIAEGNDSLDKKYKVNLKLSDKMVIISNLTILSVAPLNDGEYICEKQMKVLSGYQTIDQDETNLVVLQDVTELTLTIGSTLVTPEDKDMTINIPAIGQSVKCKAKGSNPKPMLHIYMDGKDMQKEWNLQDISNFNEVVSGAKAGVRSHTTELVAEEGTLLRKSDESKLIKCTAEVPGSDFPQKAVEAHITVAYDPEFDCKNRTAIVNDRYVKLECHIKAYPPIKDHLWKDADMKITSADNNGTVEYTQTHTSNGEEFHTTLTIEKVARRHFNTTFFLEVITEDNKRHTHPIRLIEKQWTSAASKPYLAVLMYSCVTVLAMLFSNW